MRLITTPGKSGSPEMEGVSTHHTPLYGVILQRIRESPDDSISFAEFMDLALYHDEWGYYADSAVRKIGRTGDFYTSVSVGDCFGRLLGAEISRRWKEEMGGAGPFVIAEQGAHDGLLALDVLNGLVETDSELVKGLRYVIFEPSPRRRRILRERLAVAPVPVEVVADPSDWRAPVGVFLCNELLDAFPVHQIRYEDGSWKELRVAEENGSLNRVSRDIREPSALFSETRALEGTFEEGYTTEICLEIDAWMEFVSGVFEKGYWWIIDYGHEENDYYAPERKAGTLRGYREHRAIDELLQSPGEIDLTAHVDFSRLIRSGRKAGLEFRSLSDQHDFLTRAAAPWLREMERNGITQEEANRKRIRQFQTLTHPGMMGRVFKVAEFSRGL